jgi:hypothetical protein
MSEQFDLSVSWNIWFCRRMGLKGAFRGQVGLEVVFRPDNKPTTGGSGSARVLFPA